MSASLKTRGALRAGLAVVAAVAGMAACETDSASLLEPYGEPAINFNLAPAAAANLPGGTFEITRPATGTGTARLTLRNLEPLTGGVYQVWLVNETDGQIADAIPATGELLVITTNNGGGRDTARTANVSSFNGVNDVTARYVLNLTAASLTTDPATARRVAVVSIEPSAGTTLSASSPKPLWARIATLPAAGANASANFVFGNYSANAATQYVFPVVGRGRAAVRANQLFLDDSSKGRPPVGYYYAAYVVGVDENDVANDTLSLGELTAPYPRQTISLRNADVSIPDVVVTDRPFAIAASALRWTGPAGFTFLGYPTLRVALKNKLADAAVMPPNAVLTGNLPAVIVEPPEDEE